MNPDTIEPNWPGEGYEDDCNPAYEKYVGKIERRIIDEAKDGEYDNIIQGICELIEQMKRDGNKEHYDLLSEIVNYVVNAIPFNGRYNPCKVFIETCVRFKAEKIANEALMK